MCGLQSVSPSARLVHPLYF